MAVFRFAKVLKHLVSGASLAMVFAATNALAGEPVFGWIYTTDLVPKGHTEFEQQAFLQKSQSRGDFSYWKFRTELEYGVSENLQVAGYLNTSYVSAYRNGVNGTTGGPGTEAEENSTSRYRKFRGDSVSLEAIYRLMNPYTDGFGLAVYFEPTIGPEVRELEARLLLQKNFLDDRLIVAANIAAESEKEEEGHKIERASVLDTTVGFSYRFAPKMAAGLEYRNHREFEGYRFNEREHSAHFLGPNFHYAAKDWWMTLAWRHQMKWVKAYSDEQREVVVNGRIYGDEHARNEFMVKVGIPF